MKNKPKTEPEIDEDELEWLEAIEDIYACYGAEGVNHILGSLSQWRTEHDISSTEVSVNTPYLNTIPLSEQPPYPGNLEIERRIENILRWNAMAMVLRGQDSGAGVGGHIATYASAATMMEVGFNHFFRKQSADYGGDLVILQPHAATGVYARSWLEGELDQTKLEHYRRELQEGEGGFEIWPRFL